MLAKSKILSGAMVAIVAQFALASAPAQAYCIQLVNFCDQLEINIDISGNAYGLWDYTCDGVTLEEMLGTKPNKDAVVAGYLSNIGTESWVFDDIAGRTLDIWLYQDGGTTAPTPLVALNQPFTVSGSCGFGVPGARSHLPSVNSN